MSNAPDHIDLAGLSAFLDALRQKGFRIGADQYIQVHELVVRLSVERDSQLDLPDLLRWLRPMLCSSLKEQEAFDDLFKTYAPRMFKVAHNVPEDKSFVEALEHGDQGEAISSLEKEVRGEAKRWRTLVVSIIAITVLAGVGIWYFPRSNPEQPEEVEIPTVDPVDPAPSSSTTAPVEPTDVDTFDITPQFAIDERFIQHMAFSDSEQFLAAVRPDGATVVYNLEGGIQDTVVLDTEALAVTSLAFTPAEDRLLLAAREGALTSWDIGSNIKGNTFALPSPASRIEFEPASDQVVTAGHDGALAFWRYETSSDNLLPSYTQLLPLHTQIAEIEDEVSLLLHSDWVRSLSYSPDGLYLASSSDDGTALITRVADSVQVAQIQHGGWVWSASYSPDGLHLATGSADGTARITRIADGVQIAQVEHDDLVYSVSYSPDGLHLASSGADNTARVTRIADGVQIAQVEHASSVRAVSYSPDGSSLATGTDDGTVRVTRIADGVQVAQFEHDGGVNSVSISPDGVHLASGSNDRTARVTRIADGVQVALVDHGSIVNSVSFSPDGLYLASSSDDGMVRITRIADGMQVAQVEQNNLVISVSYSPNGMYLATGSSTGTVHITRIAGDNDLQLHSGPIHDIRFSQDGNTLYTAGREGLNEVDSESRTPGFSIINHGPSVYSVSYSPDGLHLATSSVDGAVRITRIADGVQVAESEYGSSVYSVSYSPDGLHLATGSDDGTVQITRIADGVQVAQFEHGGELNSVSFSPDGLHLATGSADSTARITRIADGVQVAQVVHGSSVYSVSYSPDGLHLATGSADSTARITRIADGVQVAQFEHGGELNSVSYSPDGLHLATGSDDGTARITRIADGVQVAQVVHGSSVRSVSYSPDGLHLATGSVDGTARITRLSGVEQVAQVVHGSSVRSVSYSPDGLHLATGSVDGTARITSIMDGVQVAQVGRGSTIESLRYSPDGLHLATGSDDGTARITRIADGVQVAQVVHDGVVWSVSYSPDGLHLATGSGDGTARITRIADGVQVAQVVHDGVVWSVSYSPDGLHLATGTDNGTVRITRIADGAQVAKYEYDGSIYDVIYSPDGAHLAIRDSRGFQSSVFLIHLPDGQEVLRVEHSDFANSIGFSPDGLYLVIGYAESYVDIIRIADGQQVNRFEHPFSVFDANYSLEGGQLGIGGPEGVVRVLQATTSEEVSRFNHGNSIFSVRFSPDGSHLATGHEDGKAHITRITDEVLLAIFRAGYFDWGITLASDGAGVLRVKDGSLSVKAPGRFDSGEQRRHLSQNILASAINVKQGHIFTGLTDGTAILWHGATLDTLAVLRDSSATPLKGGIFSPSGQLFAAQDSAGGVHVWTTPLSRFNGAARMIAGIGRMPLSIGMLGLLAIVLIVYLRRRRMQPYLMRHAMQDAPEVQQVELEGLDSSLFRVLPLFRMAQRFRRRVHEPSTRLQPRATVTASLDNAGFFTPVFGTRHYVPEYLVLIDRTAFGDHQAEFVDDFLNRLEAEQVLIERYYFDHDPRVCFPVDPAKRPMSLASLARQYSNHRLLVFSEAGGFLSPLTGELQNWTTPVMQWPHRALLTPEPEARWARREALLQELFDLHPASPEGLAAMVREEPLPLPTSPLAQSAYPFMLRDRPRHWISRVAPSTPEVDEMLEAVQGYLGPEGFEWLTACAAYPELQWKLTLNVGYLLGREGAQDEQTLEATRLAALARLPWFRYNYIPDWLRLRLVGNLDEEARLRIQWVYDTLFMRLSEGKASVGDLNIAKPVRKTMRQQVKGTFNRLRGTLPDDHLLQDAVFLRFMTDRAPEPLRLRLPRALMSMVDSLPDLSSFQAADARRLRNRLIGGAFAAAILLFFLIKGWFWLPQEPMPVTEWQAEAPVVNTATNVRALIDGLDWSSVPDAAIIGPARADMVYGVRYLVMDLPGRLPLVDALPENRGDNVAYFEMAIEIDAAGNVVNLVPLNGFTQDRTSRELRDEVTNALLSWQFDTVAPGTPDQLGRVIVVYEPE